MEVTHTGACHCGAVSFTLLAPAEITAWYVLLIYVIVSDGIEGVSQSQAVQLLHLQDEGQRALHGPQAEAYISQRIGLLV